MNARITWLSIWVAISLSMIVACDRQPKAPVIESVQPNSVDQGESVVISIYGEFYLDARVSERKASRSRLEAGFTAHFGEVELEDVKYVTFEQLTAKVPSSLPIGIYDLSIEDPAGRRATLKEAFTVTRREVQITIEDAPEGLGTQIDDVELRVGQVLSLYAVGRKVDGSFVDNLQATWTVLGEMGTLDNPAGTEVLFTATSQGSGSIMGESDDYGRDETGVITVTRCTTDQQCADPCRSLSKCEDGSCILGAVDKDSDADGLIDIICPGGSDCDDGNANCTTDCTDEDGDGFCLPVDCDDTRQTGAECNQGCLTFYRDADGDLYGDPQSPIVTCQSPTGYVTDNSDCADTPNSDVNCNGLDGEQCNPGLEGQDLCDGADNDCDAATDEDFVSTTTTCGQGQCASTGLFSCIDGLEVDDCEPGSQDEAADVTCDGLDGDCDGQTDEDWEKGTCGQGECQVDEVCDGAEGVICEPGVANEATDVTCDGLDGDCDGSVDEDWVSSISCGQGVCRADEVCNGQAGANCTPGEPDEATDVTCDGLDGDCDGSTDEDYIIDSSCGAGACYDSNTPSTCSGGVETLCQSGEPQMEGPEGDPTCDDLIDNDCDGFTDLADTGCGANSPPVACFTVTPRTADTDTPFDVDASCSSDDHTSLADLEVRWDWESDNTYDTGWSTVKTSTHSYTLKDVYEITAEVRDSEGLSAWTTLAVNVAEPGSTLIVTTNTNDTDLEVYGGPYTNGLSLREAITLANSTIGNDTITFSGAMTIELDVKQDLLDDSGAQIVGQPGVVIDGSDLVGIDCFNSDSNGNTIMLLEITACPGAAIRVQGGSADNVIRDCELHGNATAISVNAAGVVVGPGNLIYDNTDSEQVIMDHSFTFIGNEIRNGNGNGLIVKGNVVGAVIRLNLIHNNAGAGILLSDFAVGADDAVITDNTIVNNRAEGILFEGCNCTGATVLNNIIANNDADGVAAVCAENFADGSPDYNDYWNNGDQDCNNCTAGLNSLFVDPFFIDEAAEDYRLQDGSLLIDKGTPSTNVDRNDHAPGLYWGLAPDIGNWEVRR